MSVPLPRRRFTVDEYDRMAETGILKPEDRVELIEGEVVEMTPIGSRHAGCVDYLSAELHRLVGERAIVRVQSPVRLGDISEPEPDLSIIRPRPDFYRSRHPRAADALLLIEVAENSADSDRTIKASLYARAGIPEFWLVDLAGGVIDVYSGPGSSDWRDHRVVRPGEHFAPAAFPDAQLDAAEVLR